MVIKQYDLALIRLRREHIEEVRQWRNTDKIKSRMEYRDHITDEMQSLWFNRVNDIRHFLYLLIQIQGKNAGIIHVKDFVDNNTEVGMFIWNDEYLNSYVPVLASVIIGYLNFYLFQNSFALCKMLRNNKHAIEYNVSLGYKICDGQENNENQLYKLSKEDYEVSSGNLSTMLQKIYKGVDDTVTIQLDKEDDANGVSEFVKGCYSKYKKQNAPVRFKITYS